MSSFHLNVLLIALVAISGLDANQYCWDFDTSNEWSNTGSRDWYWSGDTSETPDFTNIDTFTATSGYMWFQDQQKTPNTGTIVTTPAVGVTIYPNDVVGINIWRHIIQYTSEYRPVLNFVSNGGTHKQNILWSFNTDTWDHVELICGSMDEPCCLTYPCTGYFSVDGSILARDELLAIDDVQVNSGCDDEPAPTPSPTPEPSTSTPTTETPTTTPTTTAPQPWNYCCKFEDSAVCNWTLFYSSIGWHWSGYIPPTEPVPVHTGFYIWEEDETAEVYTTTLMDVPYDSFFSLDYYFYSDTYDSFDNVQFIWVPDSGAEVILYIAQAYHDDWVSIVLNNPFIYPLCSTGSTCNGKFQVQSNNRPGNKQVTAIDNFSVNDACT